MAATKVKKPNEKQLAVLKVLTPARVVRVEKNENRSTKKTKSTATVVTLKDKPVNVGDLKVTAATVAQLAKAGWVIGGGIEAGQQGDIYTEIQHYEITEEGKKARRA